jgi:hypothetical protein
MGDGPSSLPTFALWTGDSWHSSVEEKVVESDFLCSQLHQYGALSFAEALTPCRNPYYVTGMISKQFRDYA